MRGISATAVLITALALEGPVNGQGQPVQQPQSQSYSAGATAVLVDVVVRTKQGQPLQGLTANDFEVFEDGVRQKIGSFSVVERAGGIGIRVGRRVSAPPPAGNATPSSPESSPSAASDRPAVAIVFDALKPDALELAQRAATAYLPMNGDTDAYVAVFAADPGLRVLQPYTDDVVLARRAVHNLTAAPTTQQQIEAERRQTLNNRLNALDALGIGRDTAVFSPDPGANATNAAAIVEQLMTELELSMLRSSESLDRDQRGFATANALLTVIQSLSVLPGRKTLVYLSEGLPASPAMQARLTSIVSTANRSNVSVYTIDAAGLRAQSTLSETRREMEEAGKERLRQTNVSRDPAEPMTRMVEHAEDLLRLDPQGGLAQLAEDTGGFLIRDTNDLSSAFRRIDEDNRFHYVLTYSPTNPEFDGKFRTIQVKVHRDGAQVFSRKGYIAVRRPASGVLGYESAALAALDHGKPPNDFPIGASGYVFPDPKGSAAVPVVVHLKTGNLRFTVDEDKGTYTGEAVVVVRIRNAAGKTVQTLSQQYFLSGASKDVATAREGDILFYRQPDLAPGVYSLETIVQDVLAQRASARLSTLTVPVITPAHVPVSTLVVVQRTERIGSSERRSNLPFYYGDMLLYPNPGNPFRMGHDAELMFYFSFYTGIGERPEATLEILHSGESLASVPVEMPALAAQGRVQHVGKLPIDKFPVGTYELRLRLRSGTTEETRNTFFTIAR
jgi:VWFA-related protein